MTEPVARTGRPSQFGKTRKLVAYRMVYRPKYAGVKKFNAGLIRLRWRLSDDHQHLRALHAGVSRPRNYHRLKGPVFLGARHLHIMFVSLGGSLCVFIVLGSLIYPYQFQLGWFGTFV